MAGPAFKQLTAAIKADILLELRKPGHKLVDRNGSEDGGLTVAGYVDYHLVKPLLNLRDDQPTREQVIEAVDTLIAKAFAKDSQARNDFKKIKLTDNEIDTIIKNRMQKFKEEYHPIRRQAPKRNLKAAVDAAHAAPKEPQQWKAAKRSSEHRRTSQKELDLEAEFKEIDDFIREGQRSLDKTATPPEVAKPASRVVMGRREPLTPRRNSNDQPPSRPLPADPIKKGAVLQTGRPLPAIPAKRDFSKPPAKGLPPDPIVGGDKSRKGGPNRA